MSKKSPKDSLKIVIDLASIFIYQFKDYNFKQNQRIHKGFGQCADTLESLFD
ncbi:hypothetical protein QK903_04175 [Streptococcus thermophilus]|uniref:hypothetical protein n=1 Tax=Streptococcus thermophilus TaxID=1308 RepID=UPI003A7FFCD0